MSQLHSAAAQAKLKAYIEADKPKTDRKPRKIIHDLKTKADFAGWCSQYPGPAKLFGKIVRRWSSSSARTRDTKGKWAAYTHSEWCEIAGVGAVSTLKHRLNRIEEAGLIERARHRHCGTAVKSFIRPTPLALVVTSATADHWDHLGLQAPTTKQADLRQMETVYCDAYLSCTGHALVTISKAERAAMRAILKEVPTLAIGIVKATVGNWLAFGIQAKKDSNLASCPGQPSLLFVRKHLQSAAEFASKFMAKEVTTAQVLPDPVKQSTIFVVAPAPEDD